jgi:NADH-quinone oxidoreductase subunit N
MTQAHYLELLRLAAPETLVLVGALAALAVDLLALRDIETSLRRLLLVILGASACGAAIAWMAAFPNHGDFMQGMLVVTPLTQWVKVGVLVLAVAALLLSANSDYTRHWGEYVALVLLSAIGLMFLVSSENLLVIFIALELASLSLYILAAFHHDALASAEAALKYFLLGSVSAAFTLFGLSLLYGLSGSIDLKEIAAAIGGPVLDPLLAVAIVMMAVGFGFKIAAAPVHLWAPDVYQAAPVPSAAFIASGSKLASFFVLAKVLIVGLGGVEGSAAVSRYVPGWVPLLAALAAVSLLLGNLAAIVQTSVRRLIAYSAIAHAGYLLLGVMAGNSGLPALVYYAMTYGITTVGAFGVVGLVQGRSGGDKLSDFAGLGQREPLLAFCMLVFMLSLAGIPPLAGFFGKFYLFSAALTTSSLTLLWLVILAIAMSAVSLYYYLQVLKHIYVAPASLNPAPAPLPRLSKAVVILAALAVIVLGCAPHFLLRLLATP